MDILISLTSAFLTATGLFFAALGATGTYNEPLKVFLSASALLMTAIWYFAASALDASTIGSDDVRFLLAVLLPLLFLLGWFISLSVHGRRWVLGIKGPINQHQ